MRTEVVRLSDGVASLGREPEIATRDIAELVAEALEADPTKPAANTFL
jgi:hypothetical protein